MLRGTVEGTKLPGESVTDVIEKACARFVTNDAVRQTRRKARREIFMPELILRYFFKKSHRVLVRLSLSTNRKVGEGYMERGCSEASEWGKQVLSGSVAPLLSTEQRQDRGTI